MNEMVERVAKAAFGARWENYPDQRPELLHRTLLAFEAMRYPTEAMTAGLSEPWTAEITWQHMIDALLKD